MRREFPSLAVEFRVEIALWDENAQDRLKDPESLWQLACADGQVLQLTAAQIMERTSTKIHVAWSDQIPDHFECYVDAKVGKAYVAPDWLRPLLERARALRHVVSRGASRILARMNRVRYPPYCYLVRIILASLLPTTHCLFPRPCMQYYLYMYTITKQNIL